MTGEARTLDVHPEEDGATLWPEEGPDQEDGGVHRRGQVAAVEGQRSLREDLGDFEQVMRGHFLTLYCSITVPNLDSAGIRPFRFFLSLEIRTSCKCE